MGAEASSEVGSPGDLVITLGADPEDASRTLVTECRGEGLAEYTIDMAPREVAAYLRRLMDEHGGEE